MATSRATVHLIPDSEYGSSSSMSSGSYFYQQPSAPGLCGLGNLGNTCFINSALQCLSNTVPLTEYFLGENSNKPYEKHINAKNPLGMGGAIARAYGDLLEDLWGGKMSAVAPSNFKTQVGRFAPQFVGYAQHDSQELLAFLLDGLHKDLNLVGEKPCKDMTVATTGRTDQEIAEESWHKYLLHNQSVIVKLFQGQLKSTVICGTCKQVSRTFDPFLFLSLPLPVKTERTLYVYVVRADPDQPVYRYKLTLPKMGNVASLKESLQKLTKINPKMMLVMDVYNSRFHRLYDNKDPLSQIMDRDDTFVYEITHALNDLDYSQVPVYQRETTVKEVRYTYQSYTQRSTQLFGLPLVVEVPRDQCTYRVLYDAILNRCRRYVKKWSDNVEEEDNCIIEEKKGVAKEEWEKGDDSSNSGSEDERLLKEGDKNKRSDKEEDGGERDLFQLKVVNSFGSQDVNTLKDDGKPIRLSSQTYIACDWSETAKLDCYISSVAESKDDDKSCFVEEAEAKKEIDLHDCLQVFTEEEVLSSENKWCCPQCKEIKGAKKKFDLWKLPQVLIIHLKRFSDDKNKLDDLVDFPIGGLDLSSFVEGRGPQPLYDLYAVSNHSGGMGGGHYTAYAKNSNTGKWYNFDDSHVAECAEKSIVTSAAYLLFYHRRTKSADMSRGDSMKEDEEEEEEEDTGENKKKEDNMDEYGEECDLQPSNEEGDQFTQPRSDATELYEEAMKEGSVNISIIKCLVLGIAGVGKTHLKWLLLSENTDKHTGRVSTGIADNPVHAFVGSVKSILAGVDEKDTGNWEVLDESKLMQVLINAYQNEPSPISASVSIATQASPRPAAHQQPSRLADPLSKLHVDVKVPSPSSIEPVLAPSIEHQEISSDLPMEDKFNDNPAAGVISSRFIEEFKKARGKNVLHFKVTLVQFIDSGGQPQFLDILPAFIQDVSAIVFAVNLSESLDHCPEVYFYGQNSQPVGKPYTSPSSHKQVLEQCMRAFATNARGSHPYLFVMGTHRDEEQNCTETKKEKDEIIKRVANSEFLIHKTGVEAIWEVNSKTPEKEDEEVAHKLRRSIVANCSKGNHRHLPLKWFVLEMQIRASAPQGVLSLKMCLQQAQRLDMDEKGLEAALLHMVKYNLFLWYHEVPGLREVVFSDPQVTLKIITALVQCKHELAGRDDVPESFTSEGAKNDWCINFRDHAIVRNEFLSHQNFQKHFIDGVFTVKHFTELMCHLLIMVPLENVNGYLMPALLDPLNLDDISIHQGPNPLLVCFPNEFAPHGLFSFLVAFLQHKECLLVENNKVPACLYRNCVSFKCRKYPARFTIIDSVSYIEVHLNDGVRTKVCPKIRKLIHTGVRDCANILKYCGGKELKDGFICSIESCKCAAIPYEDDPILAHCTRCSCDMTLTNGHTDWLGKEGPTQVSTSMAASSSSQVLSELVVQVMPQLEGTPIMPELLSLSVKKVNVAVEVGVRYSSFGIFLLNDANGAIVQALEMEHHWNAERINMAILQRWLQGMGVKPVTWSTLVDVLRRIEI